MHGGMIDLVIDGSMATGSSAAPGAGVMLEMNRQYAHPATSALRCEGRVLKHFSHLESCLTNGDTKLLAVATATWQHLAG
jgi:hypothetical protein